MRESAGAADVLLRDSWRGMAPAWAIATGLYFLLAALRATALSAGLLPLLPVMFLIMAASPWLLFHRSGRNRMDLYSSPLLRRAIAAALAAALAAAVVVTIGDALFGETSANWRHNLRDQMPAPERRPPGAWGALVLILPAVTFSPFGEELFFRGVLHEAYRIRWGFRAAALINAVGFALVHLFHHGLAIEGGKLFIGLASAATWLVLMAAAALLLTAARRWTGSIGGAVLAHAGFNLALVLMVA